MDMNNFEVREPHGYRKHPRGSSPAPREQREGFAGRERTLHSIGQHVEDVRETRPAKQEDARKELMLEEEAQASQSKSLWRDEGGESG